MNLKTEHFKVRDIAAICVYDNAVAGLKPIVILLHGAGSGKESGLESARQIASKGRFAVVFDAYGYGESPSAGQELNDPMEIFKLYIETSRYINLLIQDFSDHPEADAERVGLIGFSMGAHIIYYYLAHEYNNAVKVAVPISGSPRWDHIVRRFILTMNQYGHLKKEQTIQNYESRVALFHPLAFLFDLNDLPLLMLTGEIDDKMPVDDLVFFYNQIEKNYINKDEVVLKVYPGVRHQLTKEMLNDSMMWIARHI